MSDDMRILTVRQPWAWAIIHGGKDVENRVSNLAGDYRGPVAIHAGLAAFEQDNLASQAHKSAHGTNTSTGMHFGAIIGVVDLVDVHAGGFIGNEKCAALNGSWLRERCSPWGEDDVYHLELANPRPLRHPLPFKGALGLRKLDQSTIERILKELV